MELKRRIYSSLFSHSFSTFNRTSMELKLHNLRRLPYLLIALLIEPVWNWNFLDTPFGFHVEALLIEPVWNWNSYPITPGGMLLWSFNRTSMELKPLWLRKTLNLRGLLIEPVWNWNHGLTWVAGQPLLTFNRTSMELKHPKNVWIAACTSDF